MQNLYLVTLLDCMLAKMFRAKISRINLLLSKFCLATSTNLILTSLSLMEYSLEAVILPKRRENLIWKNYKTKIQVLS
jgi:hypothetical protein